MPQPNLNCISCERQSDVSFFCVTCSDILCTTCMKYHLKNTFTSDHDSKPLSEINLERPPPKAYVGKCTEHKGKILEFFCVDHEVACCSTCVSMDHRKCEEVVAIEDAAHSFLADNNDDKIEEDLVALEKDMETISLHNKNSLDEINVQYKERVSTMEKVFKDLLNTVEEFGTKRKSELEVLFNEKKHDVNADNVLLENKLTAIRKDKDVLNTSKAEASDIEFMLEAIQIRNRANNYKDTLREMAGKYSVELEVTLDSTDDIEKVTKNLDTLFRVDVKAKMTDLNLVSEEIDQRIFQFNRFDSWYSEWRITPNVSINAIYFSVSKAILLVGIVSYGTDGRCGVTTSISLSVDNITLAEIGGCSLRAIDAGDERLLEVKFPYLVPLQPDIKYRLDLQADGTGEREAYNYGGRGDDVVECEGVEFTFENVPESATSVKEGQIPGLIFKFN